MGKKKKKVRSLQHQVTFTFIGLLLLSILTIFIINGAFLEKYYVSKKIETLQEAMDTLSQITTEELADDASSGNEDSDLPSEIVQASSRNNLTWVVINDDNSKALCGRKRRTNYEANCFSAMPATWIWTMARERF